MKYVYAIQPWKVGSKNGKTLVVSIPANIIKAYKIDTSTIFFLRAEEKTGIVTIRNISEDWEVTRKRTAMGFDMECDSDTNQKSSEIKPDIKGDTYDE